ILLYSTVIVSTSSSCSSLLGLHVSLQPFILALSCSFECVLKNCSLSAYQRRQSGLRSGDVVDSIFPGKFSNNHDYAFLVIYTKNLHSFRQICHLQLHFYIMDKLFYFTTSERILRPPTQYLGVATPQPQE